jgi:hypothetical protein
MFSRFAQASSRPLTRSFASSSASQKSRVWPIILTGTAVGLTAWGLSDRDWFPVKKANAETRVAEDNANPRVTETAHLPGDSQSLKKKAGGLISDVMQPYGPVRGINCHTDSILFFSGEPKRQMEVHSLCNWMNDDVAQCLLYDSDRSNARLIGVEYLVSERIFKALPEDEQKLWSSKQFEVKSGIEVAPRLPQTAENQLMQELVNMYGKNFCTWQVDRHYLPLGTPKMLFNLSDDGPSPDSVLLERRAKKLNADPQKLREERSDIVAHDVHPNADGWKRGEVPDLVVSYRKPTTRRD